MIVRDEEEHLGKCLESVYGAVNELIIVDTGSRDRTVTIAQSFGAKVINYKWEDNFSIPRNISLDHASGDWILILDADEVLEEQSKIRIKEIINKNEIPGYRVFLQLHAEWTEMRSLRFFKKSPKLRYMGIFHERLIMPDHMYSRIAPSDLRIIHKNWCKEDINRKMARNITLLKKHLSLYPDDIYQILDLVRLYLEIELFSEAHKLLDRVNIILSTIERNERNYELYQAHYHLYKLQLHSKEDTGFKNMISLCEDAISVLPKGPLFFYEAAKIYYKLGVYEKSIEYFQNCLALGESMDFDRSLMFPKDILGTKSLKGLGHCFFKKHNFKESSKYFNKSYMLKKDEKIKAMINASSFQMKKEEEGKNQPSHSI